MNGKIFFHRVISFASCSYTRSATITFKFYPINHICLDDVCSNVLTGENTIILDDDLLNYINENDYNYQDVIDCLDDNGTFDIQIDNLEIKSRLEIKNGIKITSSSRDIDKNAKITCPSDNTLFTIKSTIFHTLSNLIMM